MLNLKLAAREINEILWRTRKTISTAESCSAGRLATILTNVPGASAYFRGGLVAYAEDIKTDQLGVSAEVLAKKTAACEDVVRQMVSGACRLFATDYAVAVSGFAGPGAPDPSTGLRAGTIWVAAGSPEDTRTLCLTEDDGRERNIDRATAAALDLLLSILREDLQAVLLAERSAEEA